MSQAITRVAPSARATATAISPIGPQPLTSTDSPETPSPARQAWTAMPKGSSIAAVSCARSGGLTQAIDAGTVSDSANAPSMSIPG